MKMVLTGKKEMNLKCKNNRRFTYPCLDDNKLEPDNVNQELKKDLRRHKNEKIVLMVIYWQSGIKICRRILRSFSYNFKRIKSNFARESIRCLGFCKVSHSNKNLIPIIIIDCNLIAHKCLGGRRRLLENLKIYISIIINITSAHKSV